MGEGFRRFLQIVEQDTSGEIMLFSDSPTQEEYKTRDNSELLKHREECSKFKGSYPHEVDKNKTSSSGFNLSHPNVYFSNNVLSDVQLEISVLHLISQFTNLEESSLRDLKLFGTYATYGAENFPRPLIEALHDLDSVVEDAEDADYPVPEIIAFNNAEQLLNDLYAISPRHYGVYPLSDGEISIDAPNGKGSSVWFICYSKGDISCLVNIKGKHRRARYSSLEGLPDGFIREAMAELENQSN